MNVCKAVSQRVVSWNSNAKTASIQLLKSGCNVVIFKLCLQAIDTLVTVSEILILKIKAVAALNLLSFSEKEWAALLQSQLFCYQNKQKQHWDANVPLNWKLHCRHFICMSQIYSSLHWRWFIIMVYCLVSTGIRFGYFRVLAVSLRNDLCFSLSWRNPDLLLPVSARPKFPFLTFSLISLLAVPDWFSFFVCFKRFCCFLPQSPYKNKIKLNRKYLLP